MISIDDVAFYAMFYLFLGLVSLIKPLGIFGTLLLGSFAVLPVLSKIYPFKRLFFPKPSKYKDGVAIVTGGSRGLGLQTVKHLLHRGQLEVVVIDICDYPYEHSLVTFVKCDVGDEQALKTTLASIIELVEARNKHIQVVVNNAGIRHDESLLNLDDSKVHRLFNINTLSHIWILKSIIKNNMKNGSQVPLFIVSVSSVLGALAPKNLSVYSATKAAITLIHESLSYEISDHTNIKMLLVSPGQLTSGMFEDVPPSNAFFAPVVQHTDLAKKIAQRVLEGNAGVLCEPLYTNFIPAIRVLPMLMQSLCRSLSGMDNKIKEKRDI